MFKKIDNLGNLVQMNKSDLKKTKKNLCKGFPVFNEYVEDILPKKVTSYHMRLKHNDKSELTIRDNEAIFFKWKKQVYPTLKTLHMYPHSMKKLTVDKGAIKFVLQGANIMVPGLTSAGGHLPDCEVRENVAIMAEGKEHALAIGVTLMSSEEMKSENKGIGVQILHYLGDDLWRIEID